jgi:hypothetical protein
VRHCVQKHVFHLAHLMPTWRDHTGWAECAREGVLCCIVVGYARARMSRPSEWSHGWRGKHFVLLENGGTEGGGGQMGTVMITE